MTFKCLFCKNFFQVPLLRFLVHVDLAACCSSVLPLYNHPPPWQTSVAPAKYSPHSNKPNIHVQNSRCPIPCFDSRQDCAFSIVVSDIALMRAVFALSESWSCIMACRTRPAEVLWRRQRSTARFSNCRCAKQRVNPGPKSGSALNRQTCHCQILPGPDLTGK